MTVDVKAIAKENIDNRVARVFVSSTFRDMRAERKYLMETIFPDIKRRCKRLGIEFVPIDLRWGISDEQARRGETLERIFSSIDDSRPFFICLLGNSYGSKLPPIDLVTFSDDFSKRHLHVKDYLKQNRSYTDAEIRHGALDLDESSREIINFHCWLRDENVRILVEVDETDDTIVKSTPDDLRKLAELKSEIDGKWKNECDTYISVGDRNNATDLYNLVDKEILKWIISRFLKENLPSDEKDLTWEYAYALHKNPTWLENQDFEQNVFERSRMRLYVPDVKRYEILYDFITAPESDSVKSDSDGGASDETKVTQRSNVLAITGKSGTGKSSLLTNWVKKYTDDHKDDRPNDLVLTHYVSSSEGSEYPVNILRRFTEKLELALQESKSTNQQNTYQFSDESKSLEDRRNDFSKAVNDWLSGSEKRRLILVIDGLNQLSEEDGNKDLAWLPSLPDRVKLILSTVEDDEKTCNAIRRRGWNHEEIELLDNGQKKEIVKKILGDKYKKDSLTDGQEQRIRDAKVTENSLVLRVLLDELCYVGNYQNLDGEIDFYLAKEEGKEVSEVGFLKRVLERLEKRLNWLNKRRNVVASLACLLAASRYGLTEEELEQASGFNQFEVSMFLGALDTHLINRSGRYSFSHKFIERAVNDKYGSERIKEARKSLIEYFLKTFNLFKEHLGDEDYRGYLPRSCVEVPYQLRELRDWNRLYEFLLDFDVFDEIYDGELTSDFCLYWNELLRSENGCFNFDSYLKLDDSRYNDEKKARLWHKLGHITFTYKVCEISEEAYNKSLTIRRGLAKKSPEVYNPYVATTLNNLGLLHKTTGSYSLSESELKECLTIYRESPEVYNPYVARTLNNLGLLHKTMGSYSLSESELKECLTIYRESPEVYNPYVATTLNNLGDLHRVMGSYSESESELNESLTIYRNLAKKSPEVYNPGVATTLNTLGALHQIMGSYPQAESELKGSLAMRRALASKNPEVYNSAVAMTLNNLGDLHRVMGSYSESESELKESLTIRRALAKKAPEVYNPDVALTLNGLGILYKTTGSYSEAELKYAESLTIYHKLALENPAVYNPYVAMTLNNLGGLHKRMYFETSGKISELESTVTKNLKKYSSFAKENSNIYDCDITERLSNLEDNHKRKKFSSIRIMIACFYYLAEFEYKKSLEYYRALAEKYPTVYNSDVADLLYNLGSFYLETDSKNPESEFRESIDFFSKLAEKNPRVFNRRLAGALANLGGVHLKGGIRAEEGKSYPQAVFFYSQAESELERSLSLYREISAENPEDCKSDVAKILFNMSTLYFQTQRYDLAKEKLLEYVELYKKLPVIVQRNQTQLFKTALTELERISQIKKER